MFQELRDILDKREKELLAETAATVERKLTNLTVQQKKLEMSSGTIQSLMEFIERNVENATDEELITIHTEMMTKISEETEKQRQTSIELAPVENVDKVVIVECGEELKKQYEENASIVTLPMNIVVNDTEAQVGQRSQLIAHLNLQDGRPAKKMQNNIKVVTSKVDGSRVPAKIARKQQNTYIYQIEFTPTVRGRHQLEVMYNDKPVLREPVQVFVKIPPTMLGKTVRRFAVRKPISFIAFNSSEEVVVTTVGGNKVAIFDRSGKKLRSFTNEQLMDSTGVAVDGPNIYVASTSINALLKFDNTGKLLKSIKRKGSGEGEFNRPAGLTVVGGEVIVCDHHNHRLQVFTSDLVFIRQFGSQGSGEGQFLYPWDVTHNEDGNLYVTESGNNRVQVFTINGKFLHTVVAADCISKPAGITYHQGLVCISQWKEDRALYACHKNGHSILCESSKGGVATDQDGFVYVGDRDKKEVVVI